VIEQACSLTFAKTELAIAIIITTAIYRLTRDPKTKARERAGGAIQA
jgi:hypothetical protein